MRPWFATYGKSLALLAGGIVVVLQNVTSDGIQQAEWFTLATAVVGGITTYIVPNLVGGIAKYAKAITYTAAIVIGALPAMVDGGMTSGEWFSLAVLVATNLGVIVLPAPQHPAAPAAVTPARTA